MEKTRELTLQDLLARVKLSVDFETVCKLIAADYNLGAVLHVDPLLVGHSELNTRITTEKGKYVIKFFNKAKLRDICEFVTTAMKLFIDNGIPVPKLMEGKQGLLYEMPSSIGRGYLVVMEYFDGNTFNQITPTIADKIAVAEYLAKINNLKSDTEAAFDPWLLPYLASEYDQNKQYLSPQDDEIVKRVVDSFRNIDLSQFSRGVVHYDLHRDNVQKGKKGGYCIFDMETVGNGFPVIDLATYIGLTCLECSLSDEENKKIYDTALAAYQKIRPLSEFELENMDILIKGIYASNVVAANTLMKAQKDDTEETYKWYKLGKESLVRFNK